MVIQAATPTITPKQYGVDERDPDIKVFPEFYDVLTTLQ
jgi:hypothetical protein